MVTVLTILAYGAVEKTLLAAAEARLSSSADEFASLLSEAALARGRQLAAFAQDEDVVRFLSTGADEDRESARRSLSTLVDEQTSTIELWSPDGHLLLAVPTSAPPAGDEIRADDELETGVGPIDVAGDVAFYRVTAQLARDGGASSPFLVVRRRLSSGRTAELLARLVGPEARLLLGNVAGGAWTDLRGPANAPLPGPVAAGTTRSTDVNGDDRIGAAVAIDATPWLLWIDRPTAAVLEPAKVFRRRMETISALLAFAAALATYALGRQVTRPIEALTSAAEGLAGGDLGRAVPVERRDEVGRLARSFDRMRNQVSEARLELEDRVAERTADLRQALVSLEEAQEVLVRNERLAILGQLASGVGHELRNPLAVMTNAIYYLEMVLEDRNPEVDEYLGILRHQVGLSDKIVGDLLDFARIRAPQKQKLRLADLVDEQLSRLDREDGSQVALAIPSDLPAASGDPIQVGQVVLNLLTNALQATDQVTATPRVTVSAGVDGDGRPYLTVDDAGPGVAAELRTRIFEPLVTTKARGIGLGLAVSRRLTLANEGSLDLATSPGVGASFVLTLPRWTEATG